MHNKLNHKEIKDYWSAQAEKFGQSVSISWSDKMAIELEIKTILKFIKNGDHILDIGCANGYSTLKWAEKKLIDIRGVDYIPEMIEQAKIRLYSSTAEVKKRVRFGVDNILNLREPDSSYDKIIVVRVVINLGEWENQKRGLTECCRVLKKGGALLLSEATIQGWKKLNHLRKKFGLDEIPMPVFNNYLDQEKIAENPIPGLKLTRIINFASTYYLGTRVLKPLFIKTFKIKTDPADPETRWNRLSANFPTFSDYGTQKLFVFRRL